MQCEKNTALFYFHGFHSDMYLKTNSIHIALLSSCQRPANVGPVIFSSAIETPIGMFCFLQMIEESYILHTFRGFAVFPMM